MELEERYIVFKVSDVARLDKKAQDQLSRLLAAHNFVRELRGAEELNGLFIESDWPEFVAAKQSIFNRANGGEDLLKPVLMFMLVIVLISISLGIIIGS